MTNAPARRGQRQLESIKEQDLLSGQTHQAAAN
jgi:hypothetical protein